MRFVREAAKDSFTCGGFNQMEDGERKQDEDCVGKPWVESGEVQALGYTVDVEELVHIEVKKIETVAAFADKQKWTPGEEGRDQVRAAQAEH